MTLQKELETGCGILGARSSSADDEGGAGRPQRRMPQRLPENPKTGEGRTEDGLCPTHVMITMEKLLFTKRIRRMIRVAFWGIILSWGGSMVWGDIGFFVGAVIGVVLALVIDEEFYIKKEK